MDDQIVVNADGLYEFRNPAASEAVYQYFKRRNEDIPLKEAMQATHESFRSRGVTRRSALAAAAAAPEEPVTLNVAGEPPSPTNELNHA